MNRKAITHLDQEHARILIALDAGRLRQVVPLVERLFRKEEEILFPRLERFLPTESGPLAVLRSEHRSLLNSFDPAVLRDHLDKETRIFFPLIARLLTADLDAEILRGFEELDGS